MLAKIGVKTKLMIEPTPRWSVRLNTNDVSLYMVGHAGLPMADSYGLLKDVVATRTAKEGSLNAGRYSNPKFDAYLPKIASETDATKRNKLIERSGRDRARRRLAHPAAPAADHLGGREGNRSCRRAPDNQMRLWLVRVGK